VSIGPPFDRKLASQRAESAHGSDGCKAVQEMPDLGYSGCRQAHRMNSNQSPSPWFPRRSPPPIELPSFHQSHRRTKDWVTHGLPPVLRSAVLCHSSNLWCQSRLAREIDHSMEFFPLPQPRRYPLIRESERRISSPDQGTTGMPYRVCQLAELVRRSPDVVPRFRRRGGRPNCEPQSCSNRHSNRPARE